MPVRVAIAVALASVLALACVRPLAYGSQLGDVFRTWLFLLAYVVAPGVLAWRVLRPRADDVLAQLALGTALGIALESCAFVASRALHVESAFRFWPIVLAPLSWLALRHGVRVAADEVARERMPWSSVALLAVVALAIARAPLACLTGWWCDADIDLCFHTGNAAALWRGLPFEDSRIAGLISNYHYFSYALAAGARDVWGVPVEESLGRSLAPLLPAVLALTTFVAARAWTRSAIAGVVAAALVVLHGDIGLNLAPWLGKWTEAIDARSYLEFGIYRSPSMVLGLVYTTAIAASVEPWFAHRLAGGARARLALALAVFAFAASGTKGAVMPVLACGAGLVFARALVLRSAWRPALGLCAVLALPALPMSVLLAFGGGSHASAMFRQDAWQAWELSPLLATCASGFGVEVTALPRALVCATGPVWIAVYLGAAGVLGGAWLWSQRRAWDCVTTWIAGTLFTGLVLACLLRASGYSELFFLYPGHTLLALAGGAYVARLHAPARSPLVWLALFALVAGGIANVATNVRRDLRPKREELPLHADFRAGLAWLRDNTPRDAVVLGAHRDFVLSRFTERACFYEGEVATAQHLNARWTLVDGHWRQGAGVLAYPERRELVERLRKEPGPAVLACARELVPERPLFVIVDGLRVGPGGRTGAMYRFNALGDFALEPSENIELVFANTVVQVYAVR